MSKITDIDIVQRSVVLEVLRDDHAERWTLEELHKEIYDVSPDVIRAAMVQLALPGCILMDEDTAWAAPPLRHLDGLGMVCI